MIGIADMRLNESDEKVIRNARLREKTWPYIRVFWMVVAASALFVGLSFLGSQDYATHLAGRIGAYGLIMGGAIFLIFVPKIWHNRPRQLLIRLTSDVDA